MPGKRPSSSRFKEAWAEFINVDNFSWQNSFFLSLVYKEDNSCFSIKYQVSFFVRL